MQPKDGGPAFPVIGAPGAPADYPGMTLRDYFAGQALTGIMSADHLRPIAKQANEKGMSPTSVAAIIAYDIADAMLKAREGKA